MPTWIPTWVSDAIEEKIQKLEAENARLRQALQRIADHYEGIHFYFGDIALEALKGEAPKGGE